MIYPQMTNAYIDGIAKKIVTSSNFEFWGDLFLNKTKSSLGLQKDDLVKKVCSRCLNPNFHFFYFLGTTST